MPADIDLDCSLSVNEITTRYPVTIAVFNRFGIDTCCGGAESVEDAADREGINHSELCMALRTVIGRA